jgi:hypothetical protein
MKSKELATAPAVHIARGDKSYHSLVREEVLDELRVEPLNLKK